MGNIVTGNTIVESWVDISKNDCECTSREKCTGTTTTSSGAQSPSRTLGSIHDCQHHDTRLRQTHNYTVSQKNVPPLACYNFWHTRMDFDFFGRNVTDKIDNQKTLHYATLSNLCFCTTWRNGETRKSHFYSVELCYTHNAPVRCLPERKSCHLWCVW